MSDDAEVSEEVIRQMGHEIVRLREQLDASRSPHPRDEESESVMHPLWFALRASLM